MFIISYCNVIHHINIANISPQAQVTAMFVSTLFNMPGTNHLLVACGLL